MKRTLGVYEANKNISRKERFQAMKALKNYFMQAGNNTGVKLTYEMEKVL